MSEPLRILIVDDEAPARTRLKDLLADVAAEVPNRVVAEAADGVAALARLAEQAADVALVDIRMPRMDGIELARHLADLPQPPAVVFTTAYDRYAVAAFDLNAVDYLLKPVRAARLADALRKAVARPLAGETMRKTAATLLPQGRRHLRCSERGKVLLVAVDDVLYLRAEQKYVTARTKEREFLIEDSLAQLEEEFAGPARTGAARPPAPALPGTRHPAAGARRRSALLQGRAEVRHRPHARTRIPARGIAVAAGGGVR